MHNRKPTDQNHLHWEQVGGMLIRQDGWLSWRCPDCGASGRVKQLRKTCPECGNKKAP